MTALRKKLWRDLGQLRGQIIAIALVMAGGIGMVVMANSNHDTLADTRARYYAEYRFADVFANVKRAPRTLLPAINAIEGVASVDVRIKAEVRLERDGFDDPISGQVVPLPRTGQSGLNAVFLRSGRLPERDDEVLLVEAFAQAQQLEPGDRLTAVINGRRQRIEVSGIALSPEYIYPIRPGDVFPDFAHYGVLWMRPEPLARAYGMDGAFNDLSLRLGRGAVEADVIDALDDLLAPYGGTGAYGRNLQTSHRFLSEELVQLNILSRLFGAIFLGVAAFLLNVVIGRLVHSQREQIALLKAFGYSGLQIARHYVELVLVIAVTGALPGIALGAWMGHGLAGIYQDFYRFPYLDWSLAPSLLLWSLLFALLAALTGAAASLRRSYRLPPAEAMRPEAPPRYRRSLAESSGLRRLLDPPSRMVLRSLERRPLRTLLSVLGIGLSAGIMVMTLFQSIAVEYMVDVQFGFAQRDDLSVSLIEPTDARFAEELAAIPGVQAVEAFRAVPVRLRHGHRSWRGSLLGLAPEPDLKRVLDKDLIAQTLPGDGVLLTDYLADELQLRVGDKLTVEVLQGRRQQLELPVSGTVNEYLGVNAYARRDSLNRWLGDGDVSNGAWLRIDSAQRQSVLDALRARPRVAGVSDREATIQGFRQTMAEGVLTFTLIATLLAASIAAGVVYNAARITLSERGRELASLRVLGYTRRETRALLQGELFSLAIMALLPGIGLGYGLTAMLVAGFQSELYRVPLLGTPSSYGWAGLTVLAATLLSAWLVRRRLDRLDLIAVLKTRE